VHEEDGTDRCCSNICPDETAWRTKRFAPRFGTRGNEPLDLGYAQNLWDGCFRAARKSCSQWIHHGCLERLNWPGNDRDTGVQTRDCARFKDK
jgi:hypothetical protein